MAKRYTDENDEELPKAIKRQNNKTDKTTNTNSTHKTQTNKSSKKTKKKKRKGLQTFGKTVLVLIIIIGKWSSFMHIPEIRLSLKASLKT